VNFVKAFLKDESGATMIEYGLVAALVSVAAIIALQILGGQLQVIFTSIRCPATWRPPRAAAADRLKNIAGMARGQGRRFRAPPFVIRSVAALRPQRRS
jgi:pilus assembly protein Flp/PilA